MVTGNTLKKRNKPADMPEQKMKVRETAHLFDWIRNFWDAYAGRGAKTLLAANDGAFYFFLTILFFEVLITVLHTIWIVNRELILEFGVTVAAVLFIIGDALYARYSYAHEGHAVKAEGEDGSFMTLRRLGEFMGAGFIAANGIVLPALAMLLAWLRGGYGAAGSNLVNSWAIAATTVAAGLIATTSYYKMRHYPDIAFQRRQSYNHILYVLAAVIQIELVVLIGFSGLTGVQVPNDLYILLLVLLVGYVQHNHLLQVRFPKAVQRRRGHIFALAVSFFTVAMIGFASLPGLIAFKTFPAEDVAALYLITIGVFFYGTSDRHRRVKRPDGSLDRTKEIVEAEGFSEQLAGLPTKPFEFPELDTD